MSGATLKIRATRALLADRFPACFMPKGADKRPLAIGIDKMVAERLPQLSHNDIKKALCDYASGPRYHRMMVEGAIRVDLDGNPAGQISAAQAEHARLMLERMGWREPTEAVAA